MQLIFFVIFFLALWNRLRDENKLAKKKTDVSLAALHTAAIIIRRKQYVGRRCTGTDRNLLGVEETRTRAYFRVSIPTNRVFVYISECIIFFYRDKNTRTKRNSATRRGYTCVYSCCTHTHTIYRCTRVKRLRGNRLNLHGSSRTGRAADTNPNYSDTTYRFSKRIIFCLLVDGRTSSRADKNASEPCNASDPIFSRARALAYNIRALAKYTREFDTDSVS